MPIPEMAVGNNHDHAAEILQINALLADTSIGSSPTTRTIDPVTGRELRPPILTKMLVGSAWATVQIDNGATISILGENLAKLVGVQPGLRPALPTLLERDTRSHSFAEALRQYILPS